MNIKLEYASFQDFANRLWPCLSEDGMWVPSDRSAGVGELVDFDVTLADGFRLFHGTGQVIGLGPGPEGAPAGPGMTVRFSQLDGPSRNLIQKVVSKHRGEGGRPFVLAAPATKVEVVGDDEEGGDSRSLGPEDLVAPFPELEGEADWADGSEPELTSFLRPSGGATELKLEADSGGLPNLDFRADPPSPAQPPASPEETPEPPPADESSAESAPAPPDSIADEARPVEMPEPGPLVLDEELSAAGEPPPADGPPPAPLEELAEPEPSAPEDDLEQLEEEDDLEEFEETVAETQIIESLLPDGVETAPSDTLADAAQAVASLAPPDVEAVPSTVMPPDMEPYGGESSGDDEFSDDEFSAEAATSSSLAKWLWALVGLVAIVAAFFFVQRFQGRAAEVDSVSATAPTAGSEISGVASSDAASAQSGDGVDGAERDGLGADTAAPDGAADGGSESGDPESGGLEDVGSTGRGDSEGARDPEGDGAVAAPATGAPATGAPATEAPATEAPATEAPATEDSAPAAGPSAGGAVGDVTGGAAASSTASPPAADLAQLRLQRITWTERDGDTVIRLWLDGAAPREQLSTDAVAGVVPRLVLKIAGIAGATPRTPATIGSTHVQQLRFGRHSPATGPELHVVADLTGDSVEMIGPLVIDETGVELRLGRPSG